MSLRPRVDAMKASGAPRTRTAPPWQPRGFPLGGRRTAYVAFGASGAFLVLVALLVLRAVWVLGAHDAAAWQGLIHGDFANPGYLLFHAVALVALLWFAFRYFRLFPKTQPPRIGPFPRPPLLVFAAALNGGLVVATVLLVLVLGGVWP